MNIKEIAKAFDKLSKNYDLISYTMSFGVTIYWRKNLIEETVRMSNERTKYFLDLCSGTGDIAIGIYKKLPKNKNDAKIVALDISFGMLKKLKEKLNKMKIKNIIPLLGDIQKMPFKNKVFSISTMSFGARSLMESDRNFKEYFQEIYRTSRALINLETSHPKNRFLKTLYYFYLYFVIIILGSLFFPHYNKEYFRTIMNFPPYEKFKEILENVGYKKVEYKPLFGGMAAIHIAQD